MFWRAISASGSGGKDEAEKPFWISYADLMSALMVLFLVAMTVGLLAVTKSVTEQERLKAQREQAIQGCMSDIGHLTADFDGVLVDAHNHTIIFGDRARFDTNSSQLSVAQASLLRAFVPRVLALAKTPSCERWFKRVAVEGFSDRRGSYLLNLNLSLQRAQRVLCVLLGSETTVEPQLTPEQKEQIRQIFIVGGYSSNSARETLEESRRIELRLEFLDLYESRPPNIEVQRGDFGMCMI